MAMYTIRKHDDELIDSPPRSHKGYGAFSSTQIRAGDLVLQEPPLLLYPQASMAHRFCGHCLKDLYPQSRQCHHHLPCQSCQSTRFCSTACREAAASDPASHSPSVCAMMRVAIVDGATDETVSALHLLSRVYALLLRARGDDGIGDSGVCSGALQRYEAFMALSDGNRAVLADVEYVSWLDDLSARFTPCLSLGGHVDERGRELTDIAKFVETVCLKDLVNAYGIRVPLYMYVVDGAGCFSWYRRSPMSPPLPDVPAAPSPTLSTSPTPYAGPPIIIIMLIIMLIII